jgi:FMN phosphatase YigB (HAD superfamily)
MKDIVIFDMDGTLSDADHRRKYAVKGDDYNWAKFMKEMKNDPVNEHVRDVHNALVAAGKWTYILSARDEKYRKWTDTWCFWNGIEGYKHIFMRPDNDFRPDEIVKREIFDKFFAHLHDRILCVFDDRPKVIRMWRELGIRVFNCGTGEEF